jgi:hypothetical protein
VQLAQHLDLEVPLGDQRLEPPILPLQTLEPLGFVLGEAAILLPPALERLPGHPVPLHEALDREPTDFVLPEQPDDLLLLESTAPHGTPPSRRALA